MDFGANWAYKEIDVKVSGTLQEAADILRKMKEEKGEKEEKSLVGRNFSGISITSAETHKTISISSIHRSSSKEPKATIRTPRDSGKNRKILFPKAVIVNQKISSMVSESSNESSVDPITPIPDSENLFPEAVYIPANKGNTKIDVSCGRSSNESCESIKSIQRKHVQKMGQEPLEDIQYLKRCGLKKSKPDGLFPSATYIAGGGKPKMTISPLTSEIQSTTKTTTNTLDSTSLLYDQMEFISTNGRFKMFIQPLEKKQKKKSDEFPIVPKQLQSSTRLSKTETQKIKFSAQISLGTDHLIDLSGIFNGNSMKKNDVTNLVINGQSYSTY